VVIEPSRPRSSSQKSDSSPRVAVQEEEPKCWICFSDASEDTAASSRWRSPCPCSLTAHEACLLDWIADTEASNNGRRKKIQCPQCKAEIQIERPRSILVDTVKTLEFAASRLVAPMVLFIGSSTVMYMSLSYGVIATRAVLGPDDFFRAFEQPVKNHLQLVRRTTGMTIIPWMLILSRTTLADSVLPVIPMFYFVTQTDPTPLANLSAWPPSAGLSFALLPYVRAGYNAVYEHAFGKLEQKWTDEVNPRSSSGRNNGDNAVALEIEVDLEEIVDGIEVPREQAPPLNQPPLDHMAPAVPVGDVLGVEGDAAGVDVPAAAGGQRRRDYSISISKITKSILGALAFPAISAAMGELLRTRLPLSWVELPQVGFFKKKPTKFLQTQWGRCILGGCMFVVLKDAVNLYVKWKMAENHRQRSIANYKKK
jgi:hypothetical protein